MFGVGTGPPNVEHIPKPLRGFHRHRKIGGRVLERFADFSFELWIGLGELRAISLSRLGLCVLSERFARLTRKQTCHNHYREDDDEKLSVH
jgi:hypothetical protein